MIVILDFGSQYTHLISRRIRNLGVYTEILPYNANIERILKLNPKAIILSGGPQSVYSKNAIKPDPRIFNSQIPILGICYGAQIMAQMLGGIVKKAKIGEYGRTKISIKKEDALFEGIPKDFSVWMSHGDVIEKIPEGFEIIAQTEFSPISAFKSNKIYGIQFHPEVHHTEYGEKILENFVIKISGAEKDWKLENYVEEQINKIKELDGGILCAVSGGVDSTVLGVLLHIAKKDEAKFVFINTGLLRKGEPEEVKANFESLGIKIDIVDAESRFLRNLKGVRDPEKKRKIIGKTFIEVFEEYAEQRKGDKIKFLAQGTLYPDVIESGVSTSGKAHVIKSHHNVGGLPEKLGLEIVEPLRQLYKDEVRKLGRILGIPEHITSRHPFPGPGLAVRIIGSVTPKKLKILREVDSIFQEDLIKSELYSTAWQAFCVLTNTKSVGIVGDRRRYGYVVAIRAVESEDAMTADWVRFPYDFLDRVAKKIIASVPEISRVTYDITSKPPATIEWE